MSYCINCGNKLIVGSHFCNNCGQKNSSYNNFEEVILSKDNKTEKIAEAILENVNEDINNDYFISESHGYLVNNKDTFEENESNVFNFTTTYGLLTLLTVFLFWGALNGTLNVVFFYYKIYFIIPTLLTFTIAILIKRKALKKMLVKVNDSKLILKLILVEILAITIILLSYLIYEIITGYYITDFRVARSILLLASILVYIKYSRSISKDIDCRLLLYMSICILLVTFLLTSKYTYLIFGVDMNIMPVLKTQANWYKITAFIIFIYELINYFEYRIPKTNTVNTNKNSSNLRNNAEYKNWSQGSKGKDTASRSLFYKLVAVIIFILMVIGYGMAQEMGKEIGRFFFGK